MGRWKVVAHALLLVLAGACAAVALAFGMIWPRDASGDVLPEVAARIAESWQDIEVAADEAGIEPSLVAALLVEETGLVPLEGWYVDVTGVGQVSWPTWGPLLSGEGWTSGDLLDVRMGVLAVGRVLAHLGQVHADRLVTDDLLLCAYGCGTAALGWSVDCRYSRAVRRTERALLDAVLSRPEVVAER
jgi:hypothetical protein